MATIEVKVSDLTGELITEETTAARLIVEHPDFAEPIGLDVSLEEVQPQLSDAESRFVVVTIEEPDDPNPNPQRFVMPVQHFNDLFANTDSSVVLQRVLETQQQEQRGRGRRRGGGRRQGGQRRQRIDYSSPEHAGEPHRGTISEQEQAYVREHLDEVNERLRQQGLREIDPTDLTMIERYGFEQPEL